MDQYSYNMLAAKVYELEAEVKRLRRVLIYNFKLACSIGVVVGSVAGVLIGGVFPVDYKLTVSFNRKSRILAPLYPTVVEFQERANVYGGPSRNLYQRCFYSNTCNYTVEQW